MAGSRVACCVAAVVIVIALGACRADERAVQQDSEAAPASEAATEKPTGETGGAPQAVAAEPVGEQAAMKNWMLVEFSRALGDADLQWLEENGFHVDTVMGETMVRGWLERPEAGAMIDRDPRVAKIHAQMR